MQVSDTLIIAFLASPVVMYIVQELFSRLSKGKQVKAIDNLTEAFNQYKIDQAILDLSHRNWVIMEKNKNTSYLLQDWIRHRDNLLKVLPEEQWDRELKRESDTALKILRGENNGEQVGRP